MQMKKAALATFLYCLFSHGSNVKLMTLFGAIAIFVPPPFGLAAATVVVGSIGGAMAAQRSLTRAFREVRGHAHPGDFEILGEFNRIQRQGLRATVVNPPRHASFSFDGGQTSFLVPHVPRRLRATSSYDLSV